MSKESILKKLKDSDLDSLHSLYGIIGELCGDYSRMTDGYSLATGDNKFENIPDEIKEMINERQRFFSYKNTVKNLIKEEVKNIMRDDI